ncbi:iron complex outermembrane receptor protein [Paucibacter oligotrophus]|uniref:Iron complex outermembrane receptor protein n=1 Tax=Roseateles oligotrophus TaxID=1769250 RepID=A0A840LEN1_9BURK|nr:TonB-dependent siderophore receptor [Roseateles oligotrophus]MBB4845113.1 iron complex outermembrane receptor protein [Roseateles oligotrophus]
MTKRAIHARRRAATPKATHSTHHRPTPLVLAVHLALMGGTLMASGWSTVAYAQGTGTASSSAEAAPKRYDIPAGPLGTVLSRFAGASGVLLAGASDLVQGRNSPGLNGTYTAEAAIKALLAGTGLEAVRQANGSYALRQAAEPAPASPPRPAVEAVLPVVTVKAGAELETATAPVAGYVAKRSATGTKTDTPIVETPQSISVLGRQEMEDRGALSVMEALRYVPGVVSQVYGADTRGQDDWLNLRGFSGFGTSLYQDGLRMNTDANAFANQRSEPYGLERIEVLRGPASVLYGKGDAGGIVNRVSKRPRADAPREVEIQLGSRNRQQVAADIGGSLDEQGKVLYRVVGLGLTADTQDRYINGDQVSDTRLYLAPSLTWTLSKDTSLTIMSEFLRDRNDGFAFAYTPPGASTRMSSSILVGEPKFTGFDHDQAAIGYLFEHRLNDAWTVRQNTRLSDVDVTYRRITSRSLADDGRTLERRVRVFKENNKQVAIDTQVEGAIKTGDIEHKLLFGLDAERQKTSNLTFTGEVGTLDVLNPIYGQTVSVSPTADFDDSGQRLSQLGLYAQDQMRLTRNWLVTLGGRMDWTTVKTLDHMAGTSIEQKDKKFTGRVGINYLTESGWTPYFSYAESFLPTIGRDANSNAFKPTQGKLYEVGVKFTPDNGRSLYTAALFDLRKDNVLTIDTANPDYQIQKGAVRSRGLELEAKTAITRGLDLIANYTYNDVKVIKSNDVDLGKVPTSTPKQTASAWLNYKVQTSDWRGLGIGIGVRHVGATYNDAANSSRNPSFALLDAALHYDTGPWRLALNISNLTNKEQVAACFESVGGGNQCLYGQKRTAVLSAKYRF